MEDFICTRSSKLKNAAAENFVCVAYEGPKKKCKQENISDSNIHVKVGHITKSETSEKTPLHFNNEGRSTTLDQKKKQELEMKKLRYDVIKFGMRGFEKAKAQEAKVGLALSLGAKPPKKKGLNYKVLKEQRKQEKEMEKKEKSKPRFTKCTPKNMRHKNIKKKESQGILEVYGKVSKKGK